MGAMSVFLAFHPQYQPVLDSIVLSALVAGLPLYVLFVLPAVLRLPAWICALAAMLTAFVLSWVVWGMPLGVTVGAATEGMAFGLWPIGWIVLNAVFFHILIPAYLIVVMAGWKRMTQILPAVLVTAVSFAIVQFLISNFVGPELTDIIAALVSMGCLALLLRFWRPAQIYRFETEGVAAGPRRVSGGSGPPASADVKADTPGRILRAFSMYVVLTVVILVGQM